MNIEISALHPVNWLEKQLESIEVSPDIFGDRHVLFILPDNLTVGDARKAVVRMSGSACASSIMFATFDGLAGSIILKQKEVSDVEVLGPDLRRLLVVEALKKLSGQDTIANKIYSLVKGSRIEENEAPIKQLESELDEYLRSELYQGHDEEIEASLSKVLPLQKKNAEDALRFYSLLKDEMERQFQSLVMGPSIYLSRAQLLGEARDLIAEKKELLEPLVKEDGEIWISAISVFDTVILKLIRELQKHRSTKINVGTETAKRLAKRLGLPAFKHETIDHRIERYVDAPDPRREVEEISKLVVEKLQQEENDSSSVFRDCVIIARDSGDYLPYVEDVMGENGLPFHVQTRRLLALTPPFRLIASILDLMVSLERDEEVMAQQITDPLRLGYNSGRSPLYDRTFLYIETRVGNAGRNDGLKWDEWKRRLSGIHQSLSAFVNRIDSMVSKPEKGIGFLESILAIFSQKASDWKSPLEIETGYSSDRFDCVEQHITSFSGRLFKRLESVRDYLDALKRVRGEKQTTWEDIQKAFLAVSSASTFGIPVKDGDCVKVTDAGISHFSTRSHRFIVGLRTGILPRNPPSGFLIPQDFRERVNEQYSDVYILSPQTDFENERDFFEAALGPRGTSRVLLRPYLNDRGNKEDWSPFVVPKPEEADIRLASEMTPDVEKSPTPRIHWRSVAEICRTHDTNVSEFFHDGIHAEFRSLSSRSIGPRLNVIEDRIRGFGRQKITVPEAPDETEPYLKELCESIKNDPVPIFDVDLVQDCPLIFYFYRYLYTLKGFIDDGMGERRFIPEWKKDFQRGPIPPAIRRRHFSTEMRDLLMKIVEDNPSSDQLRTNSTTILETISSRPRLEVYSRRQVRGATEHLVSLDVNRFDIVREHESGSIGGAWIPDEVKFQDDNGYHRLHFSKLTPRMPREKNSLHRQPPYPTVGREVVVTTGNRSYSSITPDRIQKHIQTIASFEYASEGSEFGCDECVYSTLCGCWGF